MTGVFGAVHAALDRVAARLTRWCEDMDDALQDPSEDEDGTP